MQNDYQDNNNDQGLKENGNFAFGLTFDEWSRETKDGEVREVPHFP